MPHKCVRCGAVYPNNSVELLKGCGCGARIFLFLKNEDVSLKEALDSGLEAVVQSGRVVELSKVQPVSIEQVGSPEEDLQEITGSAGPAPSGSKNSEQPVENITVLDAGQYELDIASIMRGDPLVVRSQNGIYYLRIPAFKRKK